MRLNVGRTVVRVDGLHHVTSILARIGDGALDMEASRTATRGKLLSVLWVFVTLNYLYGDLAMMIFRPESYERMVQGMSEALILAATTVMEVPMIMVVLSWVLPRRANRLANVLAGVGFTLFVALTLTGGGPAPFYVFLSAIEMASTVFIVWYAWTWRDNESASIDA